MLRHIVFFFTFLACLREAAAFLPHTFQADARQRKGVRSKVERHTQEMRRWSRFAVAAALLSVSHAHVSERMTRNVQKVPTLLIDEVEEAVDDAEDVAGVGAEGAEESVVEMSEVELQALPKTYGGKFLKESCLSAEERQQLARMIFEAHYASEGEGKEDRAMWYQSELEVQWLEEWALGGGEGEKDTARRAVKKAVLQRVDLHKPLAYIIGQQPFYGCDIHCSPPLLCPRPETEMWTHWFVQQHLAHSLDGDKPPVRVLDMCCGTGCVGIAIAVHVPRTEVVAVDVMDEAVKASEENARRNGIPSSRYRAIKSDMFAAFLASDDNSSIGKGEEKMGGKRRPKLADTHLGSFDILVSNPPYVLPEQYVRLPPGIKLWESKLALVGDATRENCQYLYFQELCELGAAILKPKARRDAALVNAPNFILEVGLQGERVASLMERSGLWESVEVHLDYAQQLRWITASSSH
ncbi:methyltransferase [Trypanosoma conorhini]|uniref:Methyltransferase n=1 Tax=Trypanosoma conorhini TaxID=83891 RepID=A0A422P7W0_9TRYP|nr:methyltransferase [Trypanosoma conorhini]RNF13796.1 methyltransferase [Trypanosoma conorhini]